MKAPLKILSALILVSLLFAMLSGGVCAASTSIESSESDEVIDVSTIFDKLTPEGALAIVIIIVVVVGILAPMAPLAVFTVKLLKKRSEFEMMDYVILVISGIWLIAGILVFILVL